MVTIFFNAAANIIREHLPDSLKKKLEKYLRKINKYFVNPQFLVILQRKITYPIRIHS